MKKRLLAALIAVSMLLSIAPLTTIFAVSGIEASREALEDVMAEARPLLYKEHTEQTAKYLYDRYQRAEAAVYNRYATEEEITNVTNELRNAISLLAEMKGSERKPLLSFDGITEADLGNMKESVGSLVIDKENKPESAAQSIVITAEGKKTVYSNGDGAEGIIGTSPFGVDMQYTDGLRLWVKVDAAATLSITVGRRSAETTYYFTADEIPVEGEGYVTIPFYYFENDTEAEMELTGVMNYIRIEANGADTLAIADLYAYAEIIEEAVDTGYSEEKISSRGEIVDNAFYKIVDITSYEAGSPKAITLGPLPDETAYLWAGAINTVDDRMSFSMKTSVIGDLTQLWQISPDPSGNGTYRFVNKGSGCVLALSDSNTLTFNQVDYNDPSQEWSISASKGEFTIQIRGRAKLTSAGDTVKTTTTNSFKKFLLFRVYENKYTESWSDEFDGDTVDKSVWTQDFGFFMGGGTSAIYRDGEDLLSQEDGHLVIRGLAEDYNGYQSSATHAMTNGKYAVTQGRVEVRAKLRTGMGMWPAIWMMPVDSMNMARSEIDLMEMPVTPKDYDIYGDELFSRLVGTWHWASADGKANMNKPVYLKMEGMKDVGEDYHIWAVEIDKDQVRYYFDGILYNTLNLADDGLKFAFADVPRYIILSAGGIQGDDYCVLDREKYDYNDIEMKVDYVRVMVPTDEATDETPDFTTESSVLRPSSVEYLARKYNNFMYNYPLAISPNGNEAVMADQSGFLAVFDPTTNIVKSNISTDVYNAFHSAAYSYDGNKLAVGTMNGSALIYDTSDYSKEPIKIHNGDTIHYNLLFTVDNNYLILGGFNGCVENPYNPVDSSVAEPNYFRVFNAQTGALYKEVYVGSDPLSFDLSNDGKLLALTTTSNGVFIFNTSDWSEYAHFNTNHGYTVNYCRFSPDDKLLVSSDIFSNINVWDVEAKSYRNSMNTLNESSVRKFAFSPDGKYIVTTSNDTAARIYDIESGRCVSVLGGFNGLIREVGYSPNGEYIVIASYDHTMKLYSANGTYIKTLLQSDGQSREGHIGSNLIFTPDSKYVLCTDISIPSAINRWELPKAVDKSALKAAIDAYGVSDEKLEDAKKIYSLKYATLKMVYEAECSLTEKKAIDSFGLVSVSESSIKKNAWITFNVQVSNTVDSVEMLINNDGTTENILVNSDIKIGEVCSDEGYTEWIIRTYFETAGNYTIKFVDTITREESTSISIEVIDVYTTRDFEYTVNDDGTVTIDSIIVATPNIYIPDYIDGYPVTEIAPYAFNRYGATMPGLTVRLPNTLKSIGEYAFAYCSSLKKIELPEGLETIGTYAFTRCYMLEYIEIPDSVTSVGERAFHYSRGAYYVKIGSGLTSVPYRALDCLYGARSYIFEEGVEKIAPYASYEPFLCERIYLPESLTEMSSNSFNPSRLYNMVTVYGIPGSYAETFAANNPSKYTFVALADPVISGIEDKAEYDLYTLEGEIAATWDHGHIAYLNGERYVAGTAITEAGEYTLKVINGYDEYTTEITFTVVDTTPPPYKLGEMDGDGEITVADALAILRIVAKLAEPVGNQALAADCDLDGEITVADALAVLRYVAKLTDTL